MIYSVKPAPTFPSAKNQVVLTGIPPAVGVVVTVGLGDGEGVNVGLAIGEMVALGVTDGVGLGGGLVATTNFSRSFASEKAL